MFAVSSERTRKIERRTSGAFARRSIARTRRAARRRRRRADRPRRRPAVGLAPDDRVDERHQPAGHRDRAGEVVAAVRVLVPRLRHEAQREHERRDADGTLTKKIHGHEKYCVSAPPRMSPTAEPPIAIAAHTPSALGALGAFGEGRRDDRERGGGDERRAEALERTGADQHALARRRGRRAARRP